MQPEPTQAIRKDSSQNTEASSPVSQYGVSVDHVQLPRDSLPRERDGSTDKAGVPEMRAGASATRTQRLKGNASPISSLPNEILTHALSHCSPNDLSSLALVNHRFHGLVTTQHAWRAGFARFFPGADSTKGAVEQSTDRLRTEKRSFTRLTALASWRSEYMIRTRLLRSLARGKPIRSLASPSSSRAGQLHVANATVLYNSQLLTTINHLHANFGGELNKRTLRVIHGADDVGTASCSDPLTGKVENWGLADPQMFLQFSERFPGDAQYGQEPGDVVGVPNVMDVSQAFGMVHGEGSPGGTIYYRTLEEQRGRFLQQSLPIVDREIGLPQVNSRHESICSIWIAKSQTIPALSDGLIGIMTGTSAGIVSAYSVGSDGLRTARMGRGELTARWVLCPGVPIISIAVDDAYSMSRRGQNRLWAVALNALGEVFYLTQVPRRPTKLQATNLDAPEVERLAWTTGRSVYWNLVEPSRRTARPNPYRDETTNGSYTPRSSWNGMCLTKDQIAAETTEIESFIALKPKQIQERCVGWDMRRRLEVDFAGDDGLLAGEAMIVIECGIDEGSNAGITRYTRCRFEEEPEALLESTATIRPNNISLFGGSSSPKQRPQDTAVIQDSINRSATSSPEQRRVGEEWRSSRFTFGYAKSPQLTASAIDYSTFATITESEDPLLGVAGLSTSSSPWASPVLSEDRVTTSADVPGQRARFVGVGTATGVVILWDIRASISRSSEIINDVHPVRIIHTDSPEISCLALTSLYAVHGGNDGLVQAWDILASNLAPVRTLSSRFSSRARRRLVQAQASVQGVGINLFAAGAIVLDPDPTALRGVVSLGTQLKYWGFSATAADQYKSHKRRLRRSERGSNNNGTPGSGFGRGNIKNYIANERREMERERDARQREKAHLAGRFGVNLLGSEEEALAYAAMLSEESLAQDEVRRRESAASSVAATPLTQDGASSALSTTSGSSPPIRATSTGLEADIAEAIRQSLGTHNTPPPSSPNMGSTIASASYSSPPPATYDFDVPIRYGKPRRTPRQSPRQSPQLRAGSGAPQDANQAEPSNIQELSDLEYALQLSLAEEQSRHDGPDGDAEEEIWPDMRRGSGKGKRNAP